MTEQPTPRTKKPRVTKDRGVEHARARGKSNSSAAAASQISADKPMTEKQKLFVKCWAEGDSITSAARRAGYSDNKLAYRMARMPNVLALRAQYAAKYEEASQMTRQRVMDGLIEAVEMAKLMSEPATMVSGWREVGKMCGYYAPVEHRMKIDVTGNIVLDRMNSMSDAELSQVISQGSTHDSAPALDYVEVLGPEDDAGEDEQ